MNHVVLFIEQLKQRFTRVGANGKGLRVSEAQLLSFLGSREGKRTEAPRLKFSR